jgi:hypothetical protein
MVAISLTGRHRTQDTAPPFNAMRVYTSFFDMTCGAESVAGIRARRPSCRAWSLSPDRDRTDSTVLKATDRIHFSWADQSPPNCSL